MRVRLSNRGAEAFRAEEYGDSITIERRFKLNGTNSYKIANDAGKAVSFKKEALLSICDAFNINVENPLTILSQGTSRLFLANSSPAEKYNLFLKGTQLAHLRDDYSAIGELILSTQAILNPKAEASQTPNN